MVCAFWFLWPQFCRCLHLHMFNFKHPSISFGINARFLGLMLSLHVNIFRVRIYVHKVHGINVSCVFIWTVLYFGWDNVSSWLLLQNRRLVYRLAHKETLSALLCVTVLYLSWLALCISFIFKVFLVILHMSILNILVECSFQLMLVLQVFRGWKRRGISCWATHTELCISWWKQKLKYAVVWYKIRELVNMQDFKLLCVSVIFPPH